MAVPGSFWEYKTGVEIDYKFADLSRLGLALHHMSNAGITQVNPGEQQIEVVYSVRFAGRVRSAKQWKSPVMPR